MQTFKFTIDSKIRSGAPNYRFFKIVFTAALRLKLELPVDGVLNISGAGKITGEPVYKGRSTFKGNLIFGTEVFDEVIFVVDQSQSHDDLVTFWKSTQRGEVGGSKGGAHSFAEAYIGYLMGKTLESQSFPPSRVIKISDDYNRDPKFNITSWIIQNAQPLKEEPAESIAPIELPTQGIAVDDDLLELVLLNKWQTDTKKSGIPYTNYEVDACIKNLKWVRDDRIHCEVHWEDGRYLVVEDFGRFDNFHPLKENRERVFNYLKNYEGNPSRARLILTIKGNTDQWTLASATMLRRLRQLM